MTGDDNRNHRPEPVQTDPSGDAAAQRQRRPRTSKPKVKTGCNNCKYVRQNPKNYLNFILLSCQCTPESKYL